MKPETVGSYVRQQRETKGLTRKDVSDSSPLPQLTLMRTENETHIPKDTTLILIADALDLTGKERERLEKLAEEARQRQKWKYESIGNYIIYQREELSLTREDVEDKSSLPYEVISEIENNRQIPDKATYDKLVNVLHLTKRDQKQLERLIIETRKKQERTRKREGLLSPGEELVLLDIEAAPPEPLDPEKDYPEGMLATRSYAELLTYLRKKKDYSLYRLAKETGLNRGNLTRIESEETTELRENTLAKLRQGLDLPSDTKLFRKKKKYKPPRKQPTREYINDKDEQEIPPGEKMRRRREELGFNRKQAADKLKVRYNVLRSIESGKVPDEDIVERMAALYDITAEEIKTQYGIVEQQELTREENEAMSLADYLFYERRRLGLSQETLARRIGRNRATVMNIEDSQQIPTNATLDSLANAFGWSHDDDRRSMIHQKRIDARTKRNKEKYK